MYLLIDASGIDSLRVGLIREGVVVKSLKKNGKRATGFALSLIDAITGGDFKKIVGIIVVNSSESFTAVRIVAAVANTLALLYNLPLYETAGDPWTDSRFKKTRIKTCIPQYSREPNITIKRN